MLNSLSTAVTGLQQFQNRIDVIGNNIANVNTTAYKGARTTASDTFSNTLLEASGQSMQIGSGVATDSISSVFTTGTAFETGRSTDLAIQGSGFFVVRDPTSGATFATRDGSFSFDKQGYLTTSTGLRVQGYSDAGLTVRGDVRADPTGLPDGTTAVGKPTIDSSGRVQLALDNETTFTRGQILLQDFSSPQALSKEGNNLYSGFADAGPLAQTRAPGAAGLGTLKVEFLEGSNVDLAREFSLLITAQRGFQANSRIISTSDEVLQEVINLKR
jgi:flagellar hook protein FlgE